MPVLENEVVDGPPGLLLVVQTLWPELAHKVNRRESRCTNAAPSPKARGRSERLAATNHAAYCSKMRPPEILSLSQSTVELD
jgi:hypothetical protein